MSRADSSALILEPWRTNCRVTRLLIENLPASLWLMPVPGLPRKTVRALVAHLHNARSGWINTLGTPHGVRRPAPVSRTTVTRSQMLKALKESDKGIEAILELGLENGGSVPATRKYVWRNLPLDVGHVMAYFVAHEAHHRGQLLLVARELDLPVSRDVTNRMWWWQSPKGR